MSTTRMPRSAFSVMLFSLLLYQPLVAERPVNLIRDPWFLLTGRTARVNIIQPRQSLGLWKVDLGNVGLHVGDYATPGGAGNAVDPNGTRAGSTFQTLTLRPGATYRLSFQMPGDWTTFSTRARALSVRWGADRFQFSVTKPVNWSKSNMLWELKSVDFLARSPQVALRFTSDSNRLSNSPPPVATPDGYTQMEANFSLFRGLSIRLCESTLVSNESPYDRFARGDATALSARAKIGLGIALKQGGCVGCHAGPEFAGATISALRLGPMPGLMEAMPLGRGITVCDIGFYNIGVRPTFEDPGIGAAHHQPGPLSCSRQELAGKNPDPWTAITLTQRVAVDTAFKAPTPRHVELTGPCMHHGGMKSLEEVVQFYARGSDVAIQNQDNPDATAAGAPLLQGSTVAVGDFVEFLKHLTDPRVRVQSAPFDHPELILPHGFTRTPNGEPLDDLFVLPATGKTGGLLFGNFEQALQSGQLIGGP